jgi:hypothetical protein
MVANDGTDAYAPQSSLVRWVLRGVGGSALLAAYFFRILLPTKLETDLKPFPKIFHS